MNAESSSVRFVDTHIHWWDPGNPWMLMATQEQADQLGMGDIGPMIRPYLPVDYRADTARHRLEKVVWVMATLDSGGHLEEVRWVQRVAGDDPLLAGIIGSVDAALPASDRKAIFAEQAALEAFRGVRVIGGLDWGSSSADEYMRMLADGGFVYEHMGHHDTMVAAARLAERHPDVPWILEHCGWPRRPDDPADVALWREGVSALASVGSVHCKLSGLAMSVHSFDPQAQRPFLERCLEAFGIDRCMFGSNFPVDRLYGTFDEFMQLCLDFTEGASDEDREKLFSANAERVYRI